jgi:hypothetical protein
MRGAETFFDAADTAWLAAAGITPQHIYDYAEDQNGSGEPGYDRALGIELVRRDYFLNVQKGSPSRQILEEASLPHKDKAIKGIEWLPRLMPKARAKLRGELPATLMYCCGGDRRFFKAHDILPAEFLSLVWRSGDNDAAIVDWVLSRTAGAKAA